MNLPILSLPPLSIAVLFVVLFFCRFLFLLLFADCDFYTRSLRIPARHFKGRVAWITGASSGIGVALAKQLAREGAMLILTARDKIALEQVAKNLPCSSDNVHVLPLDLSMPFNHINQIAETVPTIFGRLDFVFNNAGRTSRATANQLAMEHVQNLMHVNVWGHVAATKAVLQALREAPGKGGGVIINTISIAADISTPMRSSYAATKAAMKMYFECLALEETNISVVNCFPGSVKTPIALNAMGSDGQKWGKMDPNIEKGLQPERVADRMLAATANKLNRAYIATPKEMMAVRLNWLMPSLWAIIARRMADGYRKKIETPM